MKSKIILCFAVATINFMTACSKNDEIAKEDEIVSADFNYSAVDEIQINDKIILENHSENATDFFWFFGDSTTSYEKNPIHIYSQAGTYKITLVAQNEVFADLNGDSKLTFDDINKNADTISKTITIKKRFLTKLDLSLSAIGYDGVTGSSNYKLDIDQDGMNDLVINLSTHYSSYTGGESFINMNTENGFEINYSIYNFTSWQWNPQTDTVYIPNKVLLPVVFNPGDEIQVNGDFTNQTVMVRSYEYSGGWDYGRYGTINYGIPENKIFYFALRKIDGNGTKLGWVKVRVVSSSKMALISCGYAEDTDKLTVDK